MWICMNADSAHCALWWTFSWMLELLENRALENTRNVLSHCFSTRAGYVAGKAGWLSLQVKTLYDSMIVCPGLSISFVCLGDDEKRFGRVSNPAQTLAVQTCHSFRLRKCRAWKHGERTSVGVNGPSGSIVILTVSPVKSLSFANEKKRFSLNFGWFNCIVIIVYIHFFGGFQTPVGWFFCRVVVCYVVLSILFPWDWKANQNPYAPCIVYLPTFGWFMG